jgi:hypothetical protein
LELRKATGSPLPEELRHVVVFAYLCGPFPPAVGSTADRTLLEAAHLALRRKLEGRSDAFLFVLWGGSPQVDAEVEAIRAYGFPDADIRIVAAELRSSQAQLLVEHGDATPEDSEDEVMEVVRQWLAKEHPAALPYPNGQYPLDSVWWMGVERVDDQHRPAAIEWGFGVEAFAELLPSSQRRRAQTWLAVVEAVGKKNWSTEPESYLTQQRGSVLAAMLSAWLHDFEAASGNDFDGFDEGGAIKALAIDPFMLGYELACVESRSLEELCHEYDCDLDGLSAVALRLTIEERTYGLHRALTDLFGGTAMLFCSLYWSIWPKPEMPMPEAFADLFNDCSHDRLAELSGPWRFAESGCWDED